MVKHKRWSDKPKSESLENDIDFKKKQEIVSETPSRGIKSIVVSGIKYIYIVAAWINSSFFSHSQKSY